MAVPIVRRRFNVDEYYAMARVGILQEDDRVELIEGEILRQEPAPRLRRLFTVGEYHALARAGILREDDRVELIEGEILEMTPIGRRHASCLARLEEIIMERLRKRGIVWTQNPILLNNLSEPQPDIAVLRRRGDFYLASHPIPEDILLLIEVADSTIGLDRTVKIPIYGRNGIQETWLVDLELARVEVHLDPNFHGYQTVRTFRFGESISPQAFPDLSLTVDEIFG